VRVTRGRSILFDLDGTLVALEPPADELERLRASLLDTAEAAGVVPSSSSIFSVYQELVDRCGVNASQVQRARELLDGAEEHWAENAKALHAGWELRRMRENGCSLGLVTSNGRRCVDALHAKGTLPREFTVTVTRDDVRLLKPAAEPLVRAIEGLSGAETVTPCVFVGDSVSDQSAVRSLNEQAPGTMEFRRVGPGAEDAADVLATLAAETDATRAR
jgi:phosphoglycolate phosphatase-like HAD superfamily hydrolase